MSDEVEYINEVMATAASTIINASPPQRTHLDRMPLQKVRQQTLTRRLRIVKCPQSPPVVKAHAPSVRMYVGGAAASSKAPEGEGEVRQRRCIYAQKLAGEGGGVSRCDWGVERDVRRCRDCECNG